MHQELLSLYSRIAFTPDETGTGTPVAKQHVTAFNTEIAAFGYTLDARSIAKMEGLGDNSFKLLRAHLHELLSETAGANVTYKTLFSKFPYDLPSDRDYLYRRIFGFMDNLLQANIEDGVVLSCGHIIDPTLFDLNDFSACPICQFEVDELEAKEEVRHQFKRLTALKLVSFADHRFLTGIATALLARPSSLSPAERKLLLSLRYVTTPSIPEKVTRETLPILYSFHGESAIADKISGATDILRLATFLSDENADLSLAANTKFKLSTKNKKALLRLLDAQGNLAEDMLRHRNKWIKFGEVVNPGSKKNRQAFPSVAAAFDLLRNEPEKIDTFNKKMERGLRQKRVDKAFVSDMAKRPGEFIRKLDFMLRNSDGSVALSVLPKVVTDVPTKRLFEMSKYLENRSNAGAARAFIPKGAVNKMKVVADQRPQIDQALIAQAIGIIDQELETRLAALPAMGKVYVSDALNDIVVPYNRRGDADTTSAISKGSKYPLGPAAEVIRLFVYWIGHIDVDLSMNLYDNNYNCVDQVSWTNIGTYGAVHSGDIRSAPNGASEFIDFDIDTLLSRDIRYVAASVLSFTGQTFDTFTCYAGYMERDTLGSGRKYEPESVQLKFDLNAKATTNLPIVFDLFEKKVVFADLTTGNGQFRRFDTESDRAAALMRGVLDLTKTKPTAYDVLMTHVAARGTLVEKPEDAETIYLPENLDLEAVVAMLDPTVPAKPPKSAKISTASDH